jgi:hypothetical protein
MIFYISIPRLRIEGAASRCNFSKASKANHSLRARVLVTLQASFPYFMYEHPPEEVRAALMLAMLEALPQQGGVDLAHTDEHMEFPNPPAVSLQCVLKACWPLTL